MRESIPKSLRFDVLNRDAFKCRYCGNSPPHTTLEVDHVVPLCDGGRTILDNLASACKECNRGKGVKPLGETADHELQSAVLDYASYLRECGHRRTAKWISDDLLIIVDLHNGWVPTERDCDELWHQ